MSQLELKPLVLNPPLNVTLITDNSGLSSLADFFQRNKVIGWDKETDPKKDFYWRRQRLEQFGNRDEQYVVDLLALCNNDSDLLYRSQGNYGKNLPSEFREYMEIRRPVLCSNEWLKVGVSLGFEYMTEYWNFGLRTYGFYDCALAEKCIYAGYHSLKDYDFFSMDDMFARYFGMFLDKQYQTSFTLEGKLSQGQVDYAALDTRIPLAIKDCQTQIIRGETVKSRQSKGLSIAVISRVPALCTGDNLEEAVQLQNDAIGAFQDMHIHGERIDRERWKARIQKRRERLKEVIAEFDKTFIPIVGKKRIIATQEEVEKAKLELETAKIVSNIELTLKTAARKDKDQKILYESYKEQKQVLIEGLKKTYNDLKHRATKKYTEQVQKCEGEAFLNYSSTTQLLKALQTFPEFKKLKDTNDDTLEQLPDHPLIKLIQEFRSLDKEIGTYGDAWATEWTTHPCKEEGWLHPGDGKIHHVYNQYDAGTNRSTSEKPNGQNITKDEDTRSCFIVDPPDEIAPEGYVYVTADMSSAEPRIQGELSQDPIWLDAFAKGEDLHSRGTEILFPDKWPLLALPDCAYYKLKPNGEPQRWKCKCPEHLKLRDGNKSTNFLLAYGGTEIKLARELKISRTEAKKLMENHERKFAKTWAYLEESGRMGRIMKKTIDMFGVRRLLPDPTWDMAKEKAREDRKEKLEYPDDIQKKNLEMFFRTRGRKPTADEKWTLTHREPTSKEIGNALQAMSWGIERQGKNTPMQSGNASIAKVAMGAGFDPNGKPFLWHILPKYNAKLVKFVHDELVVMCPARYGQQVADEIGDVFKRAAAIKMKSVIMEFEYNIATYWKK